MSVITPILDTLLHDVLGRRTAASALRSLNETVTAVRAAPLLNPAQHDGLPDARGAGMPAVSGSLLRPGGAPAASVALQQDAAAPAGVQARLSPVARVIADVLGRFPAPPSTLRVLTPLVPVRMAAAPLLAAQLQSSITDSGLFYEAHLARWYRGTLPITQLQREPQMLAQRPLQARVAVSGDTSALRSVQQDVPYLTQESARVTSVPAAARSAPEPALDSAAVTGDVPELEALQTLVRHQLELLAVPVLRWEGEVWAGIFMQLMIQLPDRSGHADGDGEANADDTGVIEAEVTLDLQRLGLLNVSLHLHAGRLGLALRTDSLLCMQHLESGREALVSRLHNCGFGAPAITLALLREISSRD